MTSLNQIVIVQFPISTKKEEAKVVESSNPDLILAIEDYIKEFKSTNKEIFMSRNNLFVAEDGWYAAVFESDLVKDDDVEEVKELTTNQYINN